MAFENQIRVDQHFIRARLLEDGETVEARLFLTPELADGGAVTDGWSVSVDGSPAAISAGEFDEDEPLVRLTIPATFGVRRLTISYDPEAGSTTGGGFPLRAVTDRPVANFSAHGIVATASTDGAAAVFDAVATPVLVAAAATDGAAGVFDATAQTIAAATITAIGSGLTITNNAFPRLAVLTSSLFAYHDSSSDQLRAYSANTGTGAVALSGSGLSVSATQSAIAGMGTNWIAAHIHNGSAGSLRRHNWGGSSWSQASTTSNINLDPTIIKVNATTVVVRGGQDEGTYSWGGSNFSLLTSNVPGSGASNRFGCYLEDNKIALFSPTTGGYNLETWALSGTTWSKVGNTLFVAISSGLSQSSVTALSSTRIVTYWGGATGGRMARVYNFNGTIWAQVGSDTQIGSATALNGAVAALGSSHFVHIDDVLDKLQIYSVT